MEELFTTTVSFTDNEFATLMASLQLSVASAAKHIEINGEDSVSKEDKETIKHMEELFDRLKEEYLGEQ